MNLLLNARDAIVESGAEGVIKILATQTTSGHIQVQVVDNGGGILPQYRPLLFQPFFTTKAQGQGLGLGLYTCRTIVEYHKGQINIDASPDGKGTMVSVLFPSSALTAVEKPDYWGVAGR
jgi:signal transduction histidine kinase